MSKQLFIFVVKIDAIIQVLRLKIGITDKDYS